MATKIDSLPKNYGLFTLETNLDDFDLKAEINKHVAAAGIPPSSLEEYQIVNPEQYLEYRLSRNENGQQPIQLITYRFADGRRCISAALYGEVSWSGECRLVVTTLFHTELEPGHYHISPQSVIKASDLNREAYLVRRHEQEVAEQLLLEMEKNEDPYLKSMTEKDHLHAFGTYW